MKPNIHIPQIFSKRKAIFAVALLIAVVTGFSIYPFVNNRNSDGTLFTIKAKLQIIKVTADGEEVILYEDEADPFTINWRYILKSFVFPDQYAYFSLNETYTIYGVHPSWPSYTKKLSARIFPYECRLATSSFTYSVYTPPNGLPDVFLDSSTYVVAQFDSTYGFQISQNDPTTGDQTLRWQYTYSSVGGDIIYGSAVLAWLKLSEFSSSAVAYEQKIFNDEPYNETGVSFTGASESYASATYAIGLFVDEFASSITLAAGDSIIVRYSLTFQA